MSINYMYVYSSREHKLENSACEIIGGECV